MKSFGYWSRWSLLFLPLVAMVCLTTFSAAQNKKKKDADDETGFVSMFDGKNLDGWEGNPELWSVQDGAITGQTTAEKPTKGNTFLIWRKGDVDNFELRLQFRIVGGNSGIQYRSEEVDKWVIKGYQADFDAAGVWAGTLYEEKGRGVLVKRGNAVIAKDKPEIVGVTADEKDILNSIKKEDWNDYTIVADGNHITQKLNGLTTVDLQDENVEKRKMSGLLALQLHAGPPMLVQFRNIRIKQLPKTEAAAPAADKKEGGGACADDAATKDKKIVFVAGRPSHGYGAHEHNAGCILLAKELQAALPGYEAVVVQNGWPQDESVFDGADCIVMYCDGGGGHMVNQHLDSMDKLAKQGVGVVALHYGVEVPAQPAGERFLDWIGGYFEANWSVNPHWTAKFDKYPEHAITRGVGPFEIHDEWYYHMRFRDSMKGVTPILTALPPKETLSRPDGAHSGNPHVRAAIAQGEPQHMAWAAERAGGGRGFGFTGGHDHWNWGEPNFRKVVLNAIVWCAHGEVPENGVESPAVTLSELVKNQDEPQPAKFNADAIRQKIKLPAEDASDDAKQDKAAGEADRKADDQPKAKAAGKRGAKAAGKLGDKPAFSSKVVDTKTPGHAVDIEADITGAKKLFLVVTDGGNGFGCDWADWAEPRLIGPSGEKKLTDIPWKSAASDFGNVQLNKNCKGGPLAIAGEKVAYGIGTHANSVIQFDLPRDEEYTQFKARGGIDEGGSKQGNDSSIQFAVYLQAPPAQVASAAGSNSAQRDPESAVENLDVADGLEATLFAAEPDINNITDIDIDAQGRVWACEVKNYRKHNGSRPEGDRILVLEDTDGDGVCDKNTVFYQGRDIDSAHGICVLGDRVIVSANDKVQVFFDDNGDLKSDRKETMFSGIAGTQHDHGIHAFVFGPDGKLYFNFGNAGERLKDKDGKPIIDLAGNEINNSRKPYQEGMIFRCNLDGSDVETLAWNFRNNWEVAVDSFGTLWQSDNDDDGNKGVRINYVMPYGNYGYKDEMTGAAWKTARENMEKEIPLQHWHLNDPGVVPNFLQTGAGSPTGICVYEGTLLPKVFQGQVIHCDAGPSVCRAYVRSDDGAGYKAEVVDVLQGARDNWFRPSDVCTAPDGSIFVSDWYDPGVGGHNQQDLDRGRIFRVAPPGVKYDVRKFDFKTVEGSLKALENPNLSVRYLAFTSLVASGEKAVAPIKEAIEKATDPRIKARLLWVLAKLPGGGKEAVELALGDKDSDIRITGIRIANSLGLDVAEVAGQLAKDSSKQVQRELALALHASKSPKAPAVWVELAKSHDGKDRWFLEALGIGASGQWDAFLGAWLKDVGTNWNTPGGRDILWRSRAKVTPEYLAQILKSPRTKEEEQPRYFRAFDFLSGPEKEAALNSLLQ